jgi:uncharacterized membrane protein
MKPTTGPVALLSVTLAGVVVGLYQRLTNPSGDWFRHSWYVLGVSLPLAGAMGHLLAGDAVRNQLGWQGDDAPGFQRELGLMLLGVGGVSLALAVREAPDAQVRVTGLILGVVYGLLFVSHGVDLLVTRTAVNPTASGIAAAADLLASVTLILGSYDIVTG